MTQDTNNQEWWDSEGKKQCRKCKCVKLRTEFYREGKREHSYCKVCARIRDRDRYIRDKEKRLQKDKEYYNKNKEVFAQRVKRHRTKYPQKHKARTTLRNAVFAGKLMKPSQCFDCKRNFPPNGIHGHHGDYSKPLDVDWLCARCHGARHAKFKRLSYA